MGQGLQGRGQNALCNPLTVAGEHGNKRGQMGVAMHHPQGRDFFYMRM